MRVLSRRPAAVAATVLASLALGACGGGGSEGSSSEPVVPAAREPDPCESRPPGRVADGVNDDQGGSKPGIDPCAAP